MDEIVGPVAAFLLFYLGDRLLKIDRPQLQTMMYLLLSVAGHLTIFQTRTRGSWWTVRPARVLLLAVVGTQIIATCICVFGFLVTPLWWGWAALVWGYALAWFLITDPIKLLAYRYLDATQTTAPRRQDDEDADGATPDDAKAAPAKSEEVMASAVAAAHATRASDATHANVDSLLDMKLGDLIAAGTAKELQGAGQYIAQAISEIDKKPAIATATSVTPRVA
jgi:hypothetical protein